MSHRYEITDQLRTDELNSHGSDQGNPLQTLNESFANSLGANVTGVTIQLSPEDGQIKITDLGDGISLERGQEITKLNSSQSDESTGISQFGMGGTFFLMSQILEDHPDDNLTFTPKRTEVKSLSLLLAVTTFVTHL